MTKPALTSYRILLVDDNQHGNIARKNVLEQQGFIVQCAQSGEEGLALFAVSSFDLVITDLKMPQMSGLEVIRRLRDTASPVRIILLSGYAGCLGLTESSTGADAVLCKSSKEEELLGRTIRQLMARRPRKKPAASQMAVKVTVARSG